MDRRSFITGLSALMASVTVAVPLVAAPPSSDIDRMAEFTAVWARLDDDQRAVWLTLLRALHALPEDQNADPHFAQAHRQLSDLRHRASIGA